MLLNDLRCAAQPVELLHVQPEADFAVAYGLETAPMAWEAQHATAHRLVSVP